jgi:hypothetical protein
VISFDLITNLRKVGGISSGVHDQQQNAS